MKLRLAEAESDFLLTTQYLNKFRMLGFEVNHFFHV